MSAHRLVGLFTALLAASVAGAAGCTSSSNSANSADHCEELNRCCESIAGPLASQCREALQTLRSRSDAAAECGAARATFEQAGGCAARPATGLADGVDGGARAASGHAICDAYLACAGNTTPEGLGVLIMTYGPNGSCWSGADEALCLTACRAGLQRMREVAPNPTVCPECLASSDCSGARGGPVCDASAGRCVACTADAECAGVTPACDVTKHECVECTHTAHCKAGACDRSTKRCVRCTSDAHCAAPTPFCKTSSSGQAAACVGCRTGKDCESGACNDSACCQPESCGEVKQTLVRVGGLSAATWICGRVASSRCPGASVDCGGCSRGTCLAGGSVGRCSLEDTPCSAGAPGTCLADEVCAYVPSKRGYVCSSNRRGSTCAYGGASQNCGGKFACEGANFVHDGVCRSYCLTQADCDAGERCGIYPELGYGICAPT